MTDKLRIVNGIFNEYQNLFIALRELLALEVRVDDLCISGTSDAISQIILFIEKQTNFDTVLAKLFIETEPFYKRKGLPIIFGSSGALFFDLNNLITPQPDRDAKNDKGGCVSPSSDLIKKIDDGNLVLTVATKNPQQQTKATKVLLEHSSDNVQSHEFLL